MEVYGLAISDLGDLELSDEETAEGERFFYAGHLKALRRDERTQYAFERLSKELEEHDRMQLSEMRGFRARERQRSFHSEREIEELFEEIRAQSA
tara:strand:- start:431 stop:715 length:285 start_codon:yes stop_codon:yes gene_type:complete